MVKDGYIKELWKTVYIICIYAYIYMLDIIILRHVIKYQMPEYHMCPMIEIFEF